MTTGLCLSGGGAKGAFQVGVLQYLAEHPTLFPDGFARGSGTSVGGIHMGGLVQYAPGSAQIRQLYAYMDACWGKLSGTGSVWTKRFPPFLAGLWQPSIGNNAPLKHLLPKLIDFDKVRTGTPCEVSAWDLLSGEVLYFDLQRAQTMDELVSFLAATSSFPLAFPPEQVGAAYCTDGGIADIAPVNRLIKAGCDHILAVICRNPARPETKTMKDLGSVLGVGARCLDGMENEIVFGDLDKVKLWNVLIEAQHPLAVGKRLIKLDVVCPHTSLGDPLDFSPELTRQRQQVGYDSAKLHFETVV